MKKKELKVMTKVGVCPYCGRVFSIKKKRPKGKKEERNVFEKLGDVVL